MFRYLLKSVCLQTQVQLIQEIKSQKSVHAPADFYNSIVIRLIDTGLCPIRTVPAVATVLFYLRTGWKSVVSATLFFQCPFALRSFFFLIYSLF